MNDFLKQWDQAVQEAQRTGRPVELYRQDHMLAKPVLVARTRHPAFMGATPPKHDPARDQG